jgi:hypothetical protein
MRRLTRGRVHLPQAKIRAILAETARRRTAYWQVPERLEVVVVGNLYNLPWSVLSLRKQS